MWCDSAQRYMSLQLWGITYNGIFNKKKPTLQYIRGIMKRVNEDVLKINMNAFHTTGWIKKSIIHKQALLLYLVRKMG